MSVPESKRGEGKFDVLIDTKKLSSYTIQICCNEKIFKPEYKNAMTDRLIDTAAMIFVNSWKANNVLVGDDEDKFMYRQSLQEQAIEGCNTLLALMQIAGISALNPIDHYVKEILKVKLYLRYMDDMVIIHHDKNVLESYKNSINEEFKKYGFEMNDKKTKIVKLKDGINFLGFDYRLTDTGKVLMLIPSVNVKRERKKLFRAVKLCKKNILTRDKVDSMYTSWKAHVSKGNRYKIISRMDTYYNELWRKNNVLQED